MRRPLRRALAFAAVLAAASCTVPPAPVAAALPRAVHRLSIACPPSGVPDFNSDGHADVAGIDSHADMKLYRGDGHGALTGGGLMWPTGGLWSGFKAIAAADLNGDGYTDVAGIDSNGDMRLYTGDGAGHLAGGTPMWPLGGLWSGFRFIVAGDFNGDGRPDIAGIDSHSDLKLYVGDGTGRLSGGTLMWPGGGLWSGFKALTAGDFTGDGLPDIAGIDAAGDLRLYAGDGAGHLQTGASGQAMWPTGGLWSRFTRIAAGDYDTDGYLDVAGIDSHADMRLYRGDGTGHLNPAAGGTLMWPAGGLWSGFRAIVGTPTSTCTTGRLAVMPLGDSITAGQQSSTGDGYRGPLGDLLDALSPMGSGWLYEGSQVGGARWWPHEGHGGAAIDALAANIPTWLPAPPAAGIPPSVVLFDAGTNDAAQGHTGADMLASMSAALDAILAADPAAHIVVAQITITAHDTAGQQQQAEMDFDDGLPALALSKGLRVSVVDMRGVEEGADGIHPDDAGYRDAANRWYAAMTAAGLLA